MLIPVLLLPMVGTYTIGWTPTSGEHMRFCEANTVFRVTCNVFK